MNSSSLLFVMTSSVLTRVCLHLPLVIFAHYCFGHLLVDVVGPCMYLGIPELLLSHRQQQRILNDV